MAYSHNSNFKIINSKFSFIISALIICIFFLKGSLTSNASILKANKRVLYRSEKNHNQSDKFPDFFSKDSIKNNNLKNNLDITGNNMNLRQFAQIYLNTLKEALVKATKAINSQISDKKNNDIVNKLCIIIFQLEKELLRNSSEFSSTSNLLMKNINEVILEINRIITIPKEETLENLHKSLQTLKNSSLYYVSNLKKYINIYENFIKNSQENYQTLELIPTLSIQSVDIIVHSSKGFMKLIQSLSEAQKGLLLNIQTEFENIISFVENMNNTINNTLRFSDHFAFKQYPVINLPSPIREKLYNYINSIKNSCKSVNNVFSVSESQIKTHAQQLAQFSETLWNKVAESLRYTTISESNTSQSLPQISTYSHNQVCGLYQKNNEFINYINNLSKKDINRLANLQNSNPQISIETPDQTSMRKASYIADRLPLFLLGNTNKKESSINFANTKFQQNKILDNDNYISENRIKNNQDKTLLVDENKTKFVSSIYYNSSNTSNNLEKITNKSINSKKFTKGQINTILYSENSKITDDLIKKEFMPEEIEAINTEFADLLVSDNKYYINKENIYDQIKPKQNTNNQKLLKYNFENNNENEYEADLFKLNEIEEEELEKEN